MRITTILVAAFLLATAIPTAPAQQSNAPGHGETTFPTRGQADLLFTSRTQDPVTGAITITGDTLIVGSFGVVLGTDTYTIDPLTGAFVGRGTRTAMDGSTYEVHFQGQFVSPTDTVGTYTIPPGTGRFARMTGEGVFQSQRWTNGRGSSSTIQGTATIWH